MSPHASQANASDQQILDAIRAGEKPFAVARRLHAGHGRTIKLAQANGLHHPRPRTTPQQIAPRTKQSVGATGGIVSGISRRLRALGVDPETIAKALRQADPYKPVRITADNRKRIESLLVKHGDKCILMRSKRNKVRVVSFEGYSTHQSRGKALSLAYGHANSHANVGGA